MEVTSEIFQVGGEGYTSAKDGACYIFRANGQSALIDAGCGFEEEQLLRNIKKTGIDPLRIQLLLLTHCHFDHSGGASSLRECLGCKIIAHEADALFLEQGNNDVTAATWYDSTLEPFTVDRTLKNKTDLINVGGRVVKSFHIPGHSPGSVAYLVESDGKRVLFGQDVHGPLHPSLLSDRALYQESLSFLISLEADILCEGHFGVIHGRDQVSNFIRSYL